MQAAKNTEHKNDKTLIDDPINTDRIFLLFKEPYDLQPKLAVVPTSSVKYLDRIEQLNGRKGFVFAPFNPGIHPILFMENAVLYTEKTGIDAFFNEPDNPLLKDGVSRSPNEMDGSVSDQEKKGYKKAFEACHSAVVSGVCQKVVLSRSHQLKRPPHFSFLTLFEAACSNYPEAYVYLFHAPVTGTWLGSTPEALLMGEGQNWKTVALAGTQPSEPSIRPMWDEKNRQEQQLVTEYIEQILTSFGIRAEKSEPCAVRAGRLNHLITQFRFNLPPDLSGRLGTLLAALHPTPATCGYPKEPAMKLIRQSEQYDRSYYCGFLGSISGNGPVKLYVNLRCMQVSASTLTLYAGGGIMPGSTCESEWEETESKLQTLLSLLT